jgi:cell division septation protein DedD
VNPSPKKTNLKKSQKPNPIKNSIKYFYIQAGAFSSEENAINLINRLSKIKLENSLNIKKLNKDSLHLVTIGPYDNEEITKKVLKNISKKIQLNSFIVSE